MRRMTLKSRSTICVFTESHKHMQVSYVRGTPKMSQSGLLIYGISRMPDDLQNGLIKPNSFFILKICYLSLTQVTAVLRRFLLEISPKLFMQIMGVTGLPPEDLSLLTQELADRNLDTPAEDSVGVLDVFLACIAKALTVQTKVKGGWQAAPSKGAGEFGMGRGTHSYTLARLQQQHW